MRWRLSGLLLTAGGAVLVRCSEPTQLLQLRSMNNLFVLFGESQRADDADFLRQLRETWAPTLAWEPAFQFMSTHFPSLR